MAEAVRHMRLGIDLNLSRADLGHPDRPGLWHELRSRTIHAGELRCMGACWKEDPDCPEWMYLKGNLDGTGLRQAVHLNKSAARNHPDAVESDKHKALKDRVAIVSERAGFSVEVEARSPTGKRVTDVLVRGEGGLKLGHELQVSKLSVPTIKKRIRIAREDGLMPMWTTDNAAVQVEHRAPWATIPSTNAGWVRAGTELLVSGGARTAEIERCGRRDARCPVTRGRPCGQLHVYLEAARGLNLDDLVVGAASGAWRSLEQADTRGRSLYYWVTSDDMERYLNDRSGQRPVTDIELDPSPGGTVTMTPRELDLDCNYGVETGHRRPPAAPRDPRGAVVFDLGGTAAKARVTFNWSGYAAGDRQPCRICGSGAFTRDQDGRPCHKTCAEDEATERAARQGS
ncbi:hypothetical protein OOJ91_33625 [Micromonospora lupini]|uniref:competence protein CoiA family protein n=1 Tax=Micromonospora lupini TaxID=285679 RepID=UPI00224EB312|nr:hypothetical protein [Micromonospora lupini]MCX5070787.1 hypothetical protein [Micromonospora lupini]